MRMRATFLEGASGGPLSGANRKTYAHCETYRLRPISVITPPARQLNASLQRTAPAQQGAPDCRLVWCRASGGW